MTEPEKFLVVNDKDEPLIILRGKEEIHDGPNGKPYMHRAVHVLVEIGGNVVIQKKAPGTENAGKWSSAASGHVRADESYEIAAMRELYEELGLTALPVDLIEIAKIKPCEETGNEFVLVFGYLMDPEKEEIKLDREEVTAVKILKMGALLTDIHRDPDKYSKAFLLALNKLVELGG